MLKLLESFLSMSIIQTNKNFYNLNWKIILVEILIVSFFLILLVFLPENSVNQSCEFLSEALDDASRLSLRRCVDWEDNRKSLWIGGILTDISHKEIHDYRDYTLKFSGAEKNLSINIRSKEDIPYETGKFYVFDLNRECRVSYSSTFSGMFYDPNLDQLIPLTCS